MALIKFNEMKEAVGRIHIDHSKLFKENIHYFSKHSWNLSTKHNDICES